MTRDLLEKHIWEALAAYDRHHRGVALVDAVLEAADEYARAEVGLLCPAERRQIVREADHY